MDPETSESALTSQRPEALVVVEEATRRYGDRVALDRFSISIETGAVVGILGPNGAGKTTLIELVAGLARPHGGVVRWRGQPVSPPFPRDVRAQIGVVSQETTLYDELTVDQNLRFVADLFGVPGKNKRIEEVLDVMGLSDREFDRAGSLSGGMQRRLALARAMLHDPALLVLDEPTLGVDVEARHALWGHVRSLRRGGKAILISTNHLDEAEALCDRIVVLREGRRISEGDPQSLLAQIGRCVDIDCVAGKVETVKPLVQGLPGIERIEESAIGLTVYVARGESAQSVTGAVLGCDVVQSVRVRPPDMLEVFQSLTEPDR